MKLIVAALVAASIGCGGDGGEAIAPKLSELQAKIFTPRCGVGSSCHAGDAPQRGLSLAPAVRAQLVAATSTEVAGRTLVVPGDAAASYLFEKVNAAMPTSGARMPYTNDPLSAGEIAAVKAWIDRGALDD